MKLPTLLATTATLWFASAVPANAQQQLTAPGPDGDLAGTLVAPADGQPLLLIVPGSGPTDRDGNSPLGVTAAPYRLLADALAERGIGTLRTDKRGMFGSAGAVADANDVTIDAYVEDLRSWIGSALEATDANCLWLLGHSEGGLVALSAAGKLDHLCGIVLVAAPGRPLGMVLREQLQANPGNAPILDQATAAIDRLEAGKHVDVTALHPGLQGLFAPQVQDFLIDLVARDPAALAANTTLPLLIVQGGKDLQVSLTDGELLHAANPSSEYVQLPHMNHVLKDIDSDDPSVNIASYSDASIPVSSGLVAAVAAFLSNTP